jgi:ABC-2 type transport system permease protein
LPTQLTQAVLAKFLAAWVFIGIALALTFPMIFTVYYLGNPDTGVIVTGYLGSFLMAGAFLAIGVCMSALTKNQVISFILSVVVSLLLILAGLDVVQDFFNGWSRAVADAVASVSFLTHFISIQRGMIQLSDLIFFISLIAGWLSASVIILEMNRAR